MRTSIILTLAIAAITTAKGDDWSDLCTPRKVAMSQARQEVVKSARDLGDDLTGKQWQILETKYHRVYYTSSTDPVKLAQVIGCLDNLFVFLCKWYPTKPDVPIRTFLVPGQYGRSRCSFGFNAMRTGDQGDGVFMTTSLLHEEVHLFNIAYLKKLGQGWWGGEFSCQYFQERARLEAMGKDIRTHVRTKLPHGPRCLFGEIADAAKERFDEAFSAMFFLHTSYGDRKFREFRIECLRLAKKNYSRIAASDFPSRRIFGKNIEELDLAWRKFYGWDTGTDQETGRKASRASDEDAAEVATRIVAELASPIYQGRAAGSSGERRASRYLMSRFRKLGLTHVGSDGSYLGRFKVAYRDITGPVGLEVRGRTFTYKSDYGVLEGGPTTWAEGKMCFVGFGINGKNGDIDPRRLRGKVLLAVSQGKGLPNADAVCALAKQGEAAGVLLIDPSSIHDPSVFGRKNTKIGNKMPVLHVSSGVGEYLLSETSLELADVWRQLKEDKAPNIDVSGVCRLVAGTEYVSNAKSANVVGLLKAAGETERSVLLFAHYDGQGRDGDGHYYPSANDNASGVGVMLATATLLARSGRDLPVNVYVAALGAEEVGLVGARMLRSNKTIPWEHIQLAICLDMVGHGEQRRLTVQTISTDILGYSTFTAHANRRGWEVRPFVRDVLGSDAGVIQQSGVPTLFIITGDNRQHTLEDDAGNTDSRHMGRVAQLLADFILDGRPGSGLPLERSKTTERLGNIRKALEGQSTMAKAEVTFATDKISVQYLVQELARQAGLGYDWTGSREQIGELSRRWVHNVNITGEPLHRALDSILAPLGLTYAIQGNRVVLKHATAETRDRGK